MRHKFRSKHLIALVLCAVLLSAGPGTTFAADGDDWVEEDGGEWVGDEDSGWDDESGEEDWSEEETEPTDAQDLEPGYTGGNSGVSAQLDELYQERDQIQSDIEQLKNMEQELQAGIANAKNEKERAIAERNALAYEISTKSELIAAMQEKLRLLGEEIDLRHIYIREKQEEIDANFALLQKRLGAMYMQDDGSMLGLLIGSDSFSDFLTRSEYMLLVTEHDTNLRTELTEQRIAIEEEKAGLEEAMVNQEAEKVSVEEEKAHLDSLHVEASQQVQDMDAMEQEYMANLAENKARQQAMENELAEVFQQIEWSKNPYSGGVMTWPLPGFSTISSTYGLRFSGNDFHTGMDITGNGSGSVYGAAIVAAADGVVQVANNSPSGYGLYLMVDHGINENGQSVVTLYGHCSALLASVGQQVKRGETIAQVGSTGWSTGPHLHFEVRLGGQHVEPSQYLQG